MRQLNYKIVEWPAKGEFRISRSALTHFVVLHVDVEEKGYRGRAECRPYARYNETAASVIAQIEMARHKIESGISNHDLQCVLPAGAARNAVDCALWELKCKTEQKRIWDILDIPAPRPRITAFTLSMDQPKNMAEAAKSAKAYSLLKVKIGSEDGIKACKAILSARPEAQLIIDANEALTQGQLLQLQQLPNVQNIALIEQPFQAALDRKDLFPVQTQPIICADESLHTSSDLEAIWNAGYRAVNVKLDKTGGLTEALKTLRKAKAMGFVTMAGCMVGSSLAMAPMAVLESFADYIDLDGPLLLSDDVEHGIQYKGEHMSPPSSELWG